jgi:class I fructose-bisphosphate aldolase
MNARPALDQLGLSTGTKARLHRILYEHGLCNGTTGLIFGRNVWQREYRESLRLITQLRDILAKHPAR